MSETRHRFVGDLIAFEFAVEINGVPTPIPSATIEAALLDPDGVSITGSASWLSGGDGHVVRAIIAAGKTTKTGKHELQVRISDVSLIEPVRARVFLPLLESAF